MYESENPLVPHLEMNSSSARLLPQKGSRHQAHRDFAFWDQLNCWWMERPQGLFGRAVSLESRVEVRSGRSKAFSSPENKNLPANLSLVGSTCTLPFLPTPQPAYLALTCLLPLSLKLLLPTGTTLLRLPLQLTQPARPGTVCLLLFPFQTKQSEVGYP